MTLLVSASYALHGEVGAVDEIALIVVGLLVLSIIVYAVWRSRDLEPIYEDEQDSNMVADQAEGESG
ncbi:MAG: hypothetical protein R3300_17380 [Candidatus Promineifilaceae bacterium]|nr:hypothetical protein [Candidatus Promineifilaceae bacterium]